MQENFVSILDTNIGQVKYLFNLQRPQLLPEKRGSQLQEKELFPSTHSPLFKQGLDSHSLTSEIYM